MKKIFMFVTFLALLAMLFMASPQSAIAQSGSPTPMPVYVDPARQDGNEDGSTGHPYSTLEEGIAFAQAQAYGGRIYVKNADGSWADYGPYRGVTAGGGGTSIPGLTAYILLAILALALILTGWLFRRRSHHLQNQRKAYQ